ncbi:unnamed protein product [Cyclocybe aegerita]|uniref:Uncharacterized protein n=1 Tax=Cyclocybe aegerita TaxID=1973307 RepID=A0A8S0W105_CYCAE|nr:unnamed protein product [Cyclocybe aegerita]
MTFRRSWTAITYHPALKNASITLDFNGTAIWVYFINANNAGTGVTTHTLANFTMDDDSPVLYQNVPNMTKLGEDFNALAYSREGLPQGQHRLLISNTGDTDAYMNFDFAVYS